MQPIAGASNLVPALMRGLRLMQAFSTARPKLQMSELVAFVDAPRTTVARLVRSLVALGFLVMDSAGRFSPGPAVLGIGASYLAGATVVRVASVILDELANETLAAAQLLACDDDEMVVLAQALPVALHGACAVTRVGTRFAVAGMGHRVWSLREGDDGFAGMQCASATHDDEWSTGEVMTCAGCPDDAALPLMAVPMLRNGRVVYALSVGVQEGFDAASMVERATGALGLAAQRFARKMKVSQ